MKRKLNAWPKDEWEFDGKTHRVIVDYTTITIEQVKHHNSTGGETWGGRDLTLGWQ